MTRDGHGLRTSLYRGERFLLGGAAAGYSIYRARGLWHSVVWSEGSACRSDGWPTRAEAVDYALMRARHYGSWNRRAVKQAHAAEEATA